MIAVGYCPHLNATNADPRKRYWFKRTEDAIKVHCTEECAGEGAAPVVNVEPVSV